MEQERTELDRWSLYIYAMKAPMTRDKYKARLARFLDFIGKQKTAADLWRIRREHLQRREV